jgi:acyl-CoA thioesterase FadM
VFSQIDCDLTDRLAFRYYSASMTVSTTAVQPPARTTVSVRVLPGDTDLSERVHPSQFPRHFEIARLAFMREWCEETSEWDASVVVSVGVRVLHQIQCDSKLDITCWLRWVRRASVSFRYQIHLDAMLMCEGYTDHCVVDEQGWPRRILDVRRHRLEQLLPEQHSCVVGSRTS